jgi:hypothetical protein
MVTHSPTAPGQRSLLYLIGSACVRCACWPVHHVGAIITALVVLALIGCMALCWYIVTYHYVPTH